jgi:hypothetical protein
MQPLTSVEGPGGKKKKGVRNEWHCRAEMSAQIDLGLPERIF